VTREHAETVRTDGKVIAAKLFQSKDQALQALGRTA
jgi:hypothetical protein